MRGRLVGGAAISAYALAGRAAFTVQNPATGARFTYRVKAPRTRGGEVHFVSVLTGPDNGADYAYLGFVRGGRFIHGGAKAKVGRDAPSARAFAWTWANLGDLRGVEVFHEGRCGRCGRKLTVPTSVENGLGPECAGRAGEGAPQRWDASWDRGVSSVSTDVLPNYSDLVRA